MIALNEASSHGLCKIQLLSNALQVVEAINGSPGWSIHPILFDIKDFFVGFDIVTFTHLPRRLNGIAYDLAKNFFGMGSFVDV